MNKKRLLVVMLIVLAIGMFVSCDDSPSTALKGTWVATETDGVDTTTITMVFKEDGAVSATTTGTIGGSTFSETDTGTYTYTDSTITITHTDTGILETTKYSITKSGSTVTLKLIDEDDDADSIFFTKK